MFALVISLIFPLLSQHCLRYTSSDTCPSECLWDRSYCTYRSCRDRDRNGVTACKGSVGGVTCVWNFDTDYCQSPSCSDFDHNSLNGCTGSLHGRVCVWDPEKLSCGFANCNDSNHNSEAKCTGSSVDGHVCVWNPLNSTCRRASCGDHQHTTQVACNGVVDGRSCTWESGECKGTSCSDAENDESWCNSMPQCKMYTYHNEFTNQDVSECYDANVDCHAAFSQPECEINLEPFGCMWFNDMCEKNTANNSDSASDSAFSIAVPSLLIACLITLMF